MKKIRHHGHVLTLLISLVLGAMGCGSDEDINGETTGYTATTSPCPEKLAQILVGDSFLRVMCGCKEPASTTSFPGETLTCTVSKGFTIVFSYESVISQKQILSDGEPGFTSSPIFTPDDPSSVRSHGFYLENTGTYRFKDAFLGTLQGKIVVK